MKHQHTVTAIQSKLFLNVTKEIILVTHNGINKTISMEFTVKKSQHQHITHNSVSQKNLTTQHSYQSD